MRMFLCVHGAFAFFYLPNLTVLIKFPPPRRSSHWLSLNEWIPHKANHLIVSACMLQVFVNLIRSVANKYITNQLAAMSENNKEKKNTRANSFNLHSSCSFFLYRLKGAFIYSSIYSFSLFTKLRKKKKTSVIVTW